MRALIWTTLALASVGTPALAQATYGPALVHLSVVDRDSGETKRIYLHNRRYFVAGQTGRRYSLRIANETGERVMVVLAVDGVNVISGASAGFEGRGYILSPYEHADINGWRKNQDEVAVFRFAPLSQSYAARTGRPGDVGVIGMAVFRERPHYRPPAPPVSSYEQRRDRDSAGIPPPPAPALAQRSAPEAADKAANGQSVDRAAPRSEKLGTAHGEIEADYSGIASFEKASTRPEEVRAIEYDSEAHLVAAGVIPRVWHRPPPPHPRPFPREEDGYVPDPRQPY
jgi:hypothetical protein